MEKRKNQAALGQCILRAAAKADRMKKKNARLGDVGKGHAGMERSYIAFISYRHLPLEMATARKLHKRIERYVIPKDLRRGGQKNPGLVFRDQDELPISSNLSANIQEALDRSQYLIVICTPETAKSAWVLREISYFLEHHDRDHVLAVLADGTPETSFPPQLTELRGESGDLLGRIEPLAANIVAPNERKRAQLFRVESLRILAALIGCPFDALFRREQRYRRRRAAIALSAAALVAAARSCSARASANPGRSPRSRNGPTARATTTARCTMRSGLCPARGASGPMWPSPNTPSRGSSISTAAACCAMPARSSRTP